MLMILNYSPILLSIPNNLVLFHFILFSPVISNILRNKLTQTLFKILYELTVLGKKLTSATNSGAFGESSASLCGPHLVTVLFHKPC